MAMIESRNATISVNGQVIATAAEVTVEADIKLDIDCTDVFGQPIEFSGVFFPRGPSKRMRKGYSPGGHEIPGAD